MTDIERTINPRERMRWPADGESMREYAVYMESLLVKRGGVVLASDYQEAIDALDALARRTQAFLDPPGDAALSRVREIIATAKRQ